jgi:hypothetical protein
MPSTAQKMMLLLGGNAINEVQTTYNGEPVYGVSWSKADVALTRINASVGMVAAAGVDAGAVTNNFDTASIYGDFDTYTDADSNEFIKIPKFYIRKTDTASKKTWQICKARMPNSYLPWCFYNFSTGAELDFVYVGKYPAGTTLTGGTKLNSLPNEYPLVSKNIVEFRTYAEANGTGYQQMDIHVYDMLQVLFTVEFATLNSQAIMAGWTSGTYAATEVLTADTAAANTIVVSNTSGAKFAVGQPVGLGASQGGNQVFYGRNITQIDVDTPGAGSTTITVDGAAFNAATGNYLYNVGWRSGFSSGISASSGSLANNTNGKNPFHYRGIENLYGNVWQFVDGYNINDFQGWFCKNADDYASNVFAAPYEKIGYVNEDANGYVKYMGFDPANPMVEMPVDVSSNLYKDYYYQSSGQRIAIVGGYWYYGGYAGLWSWALSASSASKSVDIGGRLVKKG